MKKKVAALMLAVSMVTMMTGCGNSQNKETDSQNVVDTKANVSDETSEGTVYKVGIVQYVDDASLNQIEKAIEFNSLQERLTAVNADLKALTKSLFVRVKIKLAQS